MSGNFFIPKFSSRVPYVIYSIYSNYTFIIIIIIYSSQACDFRVRAGSGPHGDPGAATPAGVSALLAFQRFLRAHGHRLGLGRRPPGPGRLGLKHCSPGSEPRREPRRGPHPSPAHRVIQSRRHPGPAPQPASPQRRNGAGPRPFRVFVPTRRVVCASRSEPGRPASRAPIPPALSRGSRRLPLPPGRIGARRASRPDRGPAPATRTPS
jgi:hypothetical protein